jgi:hypothetical protein
MKTCETCLRGPEARRTTVCINCTSSDYVNYLPASAQDIEDDDRIDIIGQNGNDDLHHDPVNHPPRYTQGGIECIDAIKAALTPEEFRGYCKGNALEYVWHELHKGGDESLHKAALYLARVAA